MKNSDGKSGTTVTTSILRCCLWSTLCIASLGCGDDLTHNSAERILDEHLESTVPTLVDELEAHVGVSAILKPSESDRQVRFRVFTTWTTPIGATIADSSRILSATLRKSDQGWVIASYDPLLVEFMAEMLSSEFGMQYRDLRTAFRPLQRAYHDWLMSTSEAMVKALDAGPLRQASQLQELQALGPERSAFESRIDSLSITVPANFRWGYERAPHESQRPLLWVGHRDSTEIECAELMGVGDGRRPNDTDYYWVHDSWETCRGRGHIWYLIMTEELKAEIEAAGNLYLP